MVYLVLGVEFLLRFHLQKPLKPKTLGSSHKAESSSAIEKPDNIIDGRGALTRRQSIMITGLVIASVMIVIR
jgi:hypothetical protein